MEKKNCPFAFFFDFFGWVGGPVLFLYFLFFIFVCGAEARGGGSGQGVVCGDAPCYLHSIAVTYSIKRRILELPSFCF